MIKINSYVMPIHTKTGATVSSGKLAMKQRVKRLQRELRINRVGNTKHVTRLQLTIAILKTKLKAGKL